MPHDDKGTIGYRIDSPGGSIGFATDLGRVPEPLIELFTAQGGVDLLAIESNYDPVMQRTSSRPWFLKQRIMGGHGHLSNQQAFELARTIVQQSHPGKPARIVLLHRSQQCNGVEIVRRTSLRTRCWHPEWCSPNNADARPGSASPRQQPWPQGRWCWGFDV
ncbi:MAG: hypothetical protein HC898_05580 [Phycisphaerales bacterium]|nr:hypothetical protein [Phycisphaerales bacterium]